jgi:hypothetical protein
MGNRKCRTVAAAVLAGAVLFSPLVCATSCLETQLGETDTLVEVVPAAEAFMDEIVDSKVVWCLLAQVVLRVELSESVELALAGSWVWVGLEIVRFVEDG